MKTTMSDNDNLNQLLDDDQIREWFASRDPNRKKVNPFIDEETDSEYNKKAARKVQTEDKEPDEKAYGITHSQHQSHIRDVARHFTWIGISAGLLLAIVLTLIF